MLRPTIYVPSRQPEQPRPRQNAGGPSDAIPASDPTDRKAEPAGEPESSPEPEFQEA